MASYFDETISPDGSIIEPTLERSTENNYVSKETQDHIEKTEAVDGM